MGNVWLQDGRRRTDTGGSGGENAPRICIFRDTSGKSLGTPVGCRLAVGIGTHEQLAGFRVPLSGTGIMRTAVIVI
jgi:hypothetical protein